MTHLQHKIPWSDLAQCLRIDDTEISLPIGECGKIHLVDKATEIKVLQRKFLTPDKICISNNCANSTKLATFSKNKLSPPILSNSARRGQNCRKDKLEFINDKLFTTVLEFVASEKKKFNVIKNLSTTILPEPLDMRCTECYQYPCKNACKNFMVFSLYSSYEIEKLLWYDSIGKISVRQALLETYGGQAIGNGYRYLVLHHLLPFYVRSNAILACGYESNEDKWGELAPNTYFRRTIEYDNDFLTFIRALRLYLDKDVYMKDMTKTMELLRIIFRHIYVYIYLLERFDCYDATYMRHEFRINWLFGFTDSE